MSLASKSDRLGPEKWISVQLLQKSTLHKSWNSGDYSVDYVMFVDCFGAIRMIFGGLETGLEVSNFSSEPSWSDAGVGIGMLRGESLTFGYLMLEDSLGYPYYRLINVR